jgi:hypothetical protein
MAEQKAQDRSCGMRLMDEQRKVICREIWKLRGDMTRRLPGPVARKAVLPPPRRGPVDLLIIGQSPNQNGIPYPGDNKKATWEHSERYRFVRQPGETFDHRFNHPYYEKVMAILRRVDERLGVWWQIQDGTKQLRVEFTDALPLATVPRSTDFSEVIRQRDHGCPVRIACADLLRLQLDYYQPRVIPGNGWLPSDLLSKVFTQGDRRTDTLLVSKEWNCHAHLSGFLSSGMDVFSCNRLIQEMKREWPF